MSDFRILILSSVRPWRAWKFSNRIRDEMPGVEVCGIIQQAKERLPAIQQLIALGHTDSSRLPAQVDGKVKSWIRSQFQNLVHQVLWWIHGCPGEMEVKKEFTLGDLAENCERARWPFLRVETAIEASVPDFIRGQIPGLIVVLGEVPTDPELSAITLRGLVRVSNDAIKPEILTAGNELIGTVDHFVSAS